MNVFICWSGDRSKRLADLLAAWLPEVLGDDGITCKLSLRFDPGREWFPQLKDALSGSDAAIVCFTPENLGSLWMAFEAGVVFGGTQDRRVFPYVLGGNAGLVKDPLRAIQALPATEVGTRDLVKALAGLADIPAGDLAADDELLLRFHQDLREIETPDFSALFPDFERLFERKTFYEPLDDCSDQVWLDRYDAARDTFRSLKGHEALIREAAPPWQIWLFEKLLGHVDAYSRLLRVYLLVERRFQPGARRLDFGSPRPLPIPEPLEALPALCEHRCRGIRHVIFCLTRREGCPVFADEALAFAKLSLEAQDDKKRLVHKKESEIEKEGLYLNGKALSDENMASCGRSYWAFDRLVYYLLIDKRQRREATMPQLVRQEIERLTAGQDGSRMPLHYALRTLRSIIKVEDDVPARWSGDVEAVLRDVEAFLDLTKEQDPNTPIRNNIVGIRKELADRGPSSARARSSATTQGLVEPT